MGTIYPKKKGLQYKTIWKNAINTIIPWIDKSIREEGKMETGISDIRNRINDEYINKISLEHFAGMLRIHLNGKGYNVTMRPLKDDKIIISRPSCYIEGEYEKDTEKEKEIERILGIRYVKLL